MPLFQGIDNVLDRLFKTSTAERLGAAEAPEQVEKNPQMVSRHFQPVGSAAFFYPVAQIPAKEPPPMPQLPLPAPPSSAKVTAPGISATQQIKELTNDDLVDKFVKEYHEKKGWEWGAPTIGKTGVPVEEQQKRLTESIREYYKENLRQPIPEIPVVSERATIEKPSVELTPTEKETVFWQGVEDIAQGAGFLFQPLEPLIKGEEIKPSDVLWGAIDIAGIGFPFFKMGKVGKGIKAAEEAMKASKAIPEPQLTRLSKEFQPSVVKRVTNPVNDIDNALRDEVIAMDEAINEARELFKAKKFRTTREALEVIKKGVKSRQAEEITEIRKGLEPEDHLAAILRELKATGEYAYPKVYEPIKMAREKLNLLYKYINNHPVVFDDNFKYLTVRKAFDKALKGGIPTRGELKSIESIFGWDFRNAIQKAGFGERIWHNVVDALGLAKAMKATADISYSFRQTIFAMHADPERWGGAFYKQIRSFASQDFFDQRMLDIRSHPMFDTFRRLKLDFTEIGGKLKTAEEAFPTRFAGKIPVIKQSNRAATMMSNAARWDEAYYMWDKYGDIFPINIKTINKAKKAGNISLDVKTVAARNEKIWSEFFKFLNAATGRGNVPKGWADTVTFLNRIFFSPKFQLSLAQMPWYTVKYIKNPLVRKYALRGWTSWIGSNASLIYLGHVTGLWDVELDPRSSNVLRMRVGDTRVDLWSGYLSWLRMFARLSGKTKTESGEIKDVNPMDMIIHTVRGKLDPVASAVWSLFEGRTYVGEEFPPRADDVDVKFWRENFAPMVMNDIWDAYIYDNVKGALMASSALPGANVAPYCSATYDRWADWVAETGREWTVEELREYNNQFKQVAGDWIDYYDLPNAEAKRYWLKEHPEIEAKMYFWGETGHLSTPESVQAFKDYKEQYDIPDETFPIKDIQEQFEAEGKTGEELLWALVERSPSFYKEHLKANPIEATGEMIQKFEDMKTADKHLTDKYYNDNKGVEESWQREKYRIDNPEIDAALNLWTTVSTLLTTEAKAIYEAKLDELGIPHDISPSLEKWATTKTKKKETSFTPKSGGGLKSPLEMLR